LRDILRQYFNVECITEWKTIMSRLDAEHGIRIKSVLIPSLETILSRG
jgi:hypothetical protein